LRARREIRTAGSGVVQEARQSRPHRRPSSPTGAAPRSSPARPSHSSQGGGCHGHVRPPPALPGATHLGLILRGYTDAMRRGRWAGIVAALAIAAVAAVTAGCGGGGSALGLDPVAAAATKTQQAGAARVRFALSVSGPRTQGKTVR